MLSDEEKKAIDIIKNEIKAFETVITAMEKEIDDKDWLRKNILEIKEDILVRKTLLNLIEKQSKELEELKDKNKSLENELIVYKIYTKQDDLKDFDLFLKQNYVSKKESEQKERKAYIKGTNDADELCNKKWKDKIKAKIEIRKEEKENCKDSIEEKYLLREIYVLQSLLEKE